ncbi:MAG: response regulator [Planctomycetota bacterium]|nr:response regulator [Planctomycetota bacterium]
MASRRNDRCIDSLRLSEQEQQDLIARLEQAADRHRGAELRVEDRVPCHVATCAVATLHHPGGSVVNYLVRPRNLSRNGIGFLHGNFVHIGSRCQIHLLRVDKRAAAIDGTVVRCQHVDGLVHEIGVRFEHSIALSDFLTGEDEPAAVEADAEDAAPAPDIQLPTLSGRVLHVDRSAEDQELLRGSLEQLGVETIAASDALTAIDMLHRQPVDLIISDVSVPGLTADEFVALLRTDGYDGPVIGLSAAEGAEHDVPAGTFADIFFKPFTLEHLVEWLTPYLGTKQPANNDAQPGALMSTEWHDLQMRPRILDFLQLMERQVRQLADLALAGGDVPLLCRLSRELASAAHGHGYAQVGTVASDLHELAEQGASSEQLAARCRELEELARRASFIQREGET